MDKRAMYAEHLAQTERHVSLGVRHIARQAAIVDDLRRGGYDTEEAESLLQLFKATQTLHEGHRDQLRRELRELQH